MSDTPNPFLPQEGEVEVTNLHNLRLGMNIRARRGGNDPVEVYGQIFDISFGGNKITFDPQGRFSVLIPGWRFFQRDKAI